MRLSIEVRSHQCSQNYQVFSQVINVEEQTARVFKEIVPWYLGKSFQQPIPHVWSQQNIRHSISIQAPILLHIRRTFVVTHHEGHKVQVHSFEPSNSWLCTCETEPPSVIFSVAFLVTCTRIYDAVMHIPSPQNEPFFNRRSNKVVEHTTQHAMERYFRRSHNFLNQEPSHQRVNPGPWQWYSHFSGA